MKFMGHKARTWLEGLLMALIVGALGFAADNVSLLLQDRRAFYAGLAAVSLAVAKAYVQARYTTPPDIKERIQEGSFPERRDLSVRQERTAE